MTTPGRSTPPPAVPLRAQDYVALGDWPGYFSVMMGKPPRETLTAALAAFERDMGPGWAGVAVDLGCGEGRDARALLSRGWRVHATDSHPDAFARLREQLPAGLEMRLTTELAPFHEGTWPHDLDLINASFSLPFCPPERFAEVWARIVSSIRAGGRFAGQLFGDQDDWAKIPGRSHQTRDEVERLLEPFEVEELREESKQEGPEVTSPKRWHVFHVLARKR